VCIDRYLYQVNLLSFYVTVVGAWTQCARLFLPDALHMKGSGLKIPKPESFPFNPVLQDLGGHIWGR
jgi:hypothetical protein